MPLYEYACGKCRHEFEILVRSSAKSEIQCPRCGSGKVARKLSVFASSHAGGASESMPACTNNPRSCGRCGTGVPHSH